MLRGITRFHARPFLPNNIPFLCALGTIGSSRSHTIVSLKATGGEVRGCGSQTTAPAVKSLPTNALFFGIGRFTRTADKDGDDNFGK